MHFTLPLKHIPRGTYEFPKRSKDGPDSILSTEFDPPQPATHIHQARKGIARKWVEIETGGAAGASHDMDCGRVAGEVSTILFLVKKWDPQMV